jgi:hypothetical protein
MTPSIPRFGHLLRAASALALIALIPGAALAQDCPLTAPLTVKDTQDGFAGETGTVWTVAPDCSFTVARQIGSATTPPDARGSLSVERRARLKDLLARTSFAELPPRFGEATPVNARRVTISLGARTSVLTLAPGSGDLAALAASASEGPARRLLDLANGVKDLTVD